MFKRPIITCVCFDCGKKYGDRPDGQQSTCWFGSCDVCGKHGGVTDPRDFGYLKRLKKEDIKDEQ